MYAGKDQTCMTGVSPQAEASLLSALGSVASVCASDVGLHYHQLGCRVSLQRPGVMFAPLQVLGFYIPYGGSVYGYRQLRGYTLAEGVSGQHSIGNACPSTLRHRVLR